MSLEVLHAEKSPEKRVALRVWGKGSSRKRFDKKGFEYVTVFKEALGDSMRWFANEGSPISGVE